MFVLIYLFLFSEHIYVSIEFLFNLAPCYFSAKTGAIIEIVLYKSYYRGKVVLFLLFVSRVEIYYIPTHDIEATFP